MEKNIQLKAGSLEDSFLHSMNNAHCKNILQSLHKRPTTKPDNPVSTPLIYFFKSLQTLFVKLKTVFHVKTNFSSCCENYLGSVEN